MGVAVLWLILLAETIFNLNLYYLGVRPHIAWGLIGIVSYPFLHSSLTHLAANSLPLLVLAAGALYFYKEVAWKVFATVWLFSGAFIWLVGTTGSDHIGASGLIYGLAAFLFFGGLFRKNVRLMAISLLVSFLYGGMIWGVLPIKAGVSWEGHLGGALAGTFSAWFFRNPVSASPQKIEEDQNETQAGLPHISHYIELHPEEDE